MTPKPRAVARLGLRRLTVATLVLIAFPSVGHAVCDKNGNLTKKVEFSQDILSDDKAVNAGGEVWAEQCRHCHGKSAYPGKAPKLKPRKYKPSFVYERVTCGFRKMPPWDEVYSEEERIAVTVYILSEAFKP